jgi:integrase
MSVYKRQGDTYYSYDFRYKRQRFSGSTNCTTKREAEQVEKAERGRLKASQVDTAKPMSVKDGSALYWEQVGKHHQNDGDTLRALDWLVENIGGNKMLSAIDDAEIARLVAKRRGDMVSNATVNRSVTEPLRAILLRARETWGQSVKRIQWKKYLLKEPQERVREASKDEEAKILSKIRGDYASALRFALLTGCRRAEIVSLVWQNVDFFNREIRVTGKGDRSRTVPMTKAIYSLLWELRAHHKTAVFTYVVKRPRKGATKGEREPITMEGFKTEWRRTKGRTKISDFRFHDTRHTAATRLVRATGNLKQAQRLLGHVDIKTTTKYAHVTTDDLRAGMEAASPTENATEAAPDADKAMK